jgi:hypothetical protein
MLIANYQLVINFKLNTNCSLYFFIGVRLNKMAQDNYLKIKPFQGF